VASIRRLLALCIRLQNVRAGAYLGMLWPLVRSFLKLTPFHRRVRWFDALHRETLLSLGQHSGQRYLSWNGATDLLDASRWAAFPDEFFIPVEKL